MGVVNIGNVKKYIPDIDDITRSATRFIIAIIIVTGLFALGFLIFQRTVIGSIENPVELMQAVLVCSTALMGLSGLIIVEIKKADVPIPSEDDDDMFARVRALNTISSLVKAKVFLQWGLVLSFFSITFGCLRLMNSSTVSIVISLAALLDQLYFFVWGLLFSDLLPS